jgi:hypothetical protein
MAKLPNDTAEIIWSLQRQLSELIESARHAEFVLFSEFGETEETIVFLNELQSVAEQSTDKFAQFSSLQIRIFNVQPNVPDDMLDLLMRVIENTEVRLPALRQSVQEIITEWKIS